MDITRLKTFLDNKEIQAPEEILNLTFLATFDNDSTQANIEEQTLTFTGSGRDIINNHINDGYFFEALPLQFQLKNGTNQFIAFNGMLNLNNDLEEFHTDRIVAKMQKLDGLNTLNDRLSALTFGLLDAENLVKKTSVKYVVEKRKPFIEILISGFLIYSLLDSIALSIKNTADLIGEASAFLTTGLTGGVGAAILIAAKLAASIVYTALLVKITFDLVSDLIQSFISPVRNYDIASYRNLMEAAATKLGYKFSSSIDYLDKCHYLASDPFNDMLEGIPSAGESSNNCGVFFAQMQKMFSAKTAIIDNTIHFENKDSDFWVKDSTFVMPSILKNKSKNGDDLNGVVSMSWSTDVSDNFTIQELGSTNHFEVRVDQKDYKNGEKYLTIKGVDVRVSPFSRTARKDRLSDLEKVVKVLAEIADTAINAFGGSSNLSGQIKERVGMAKFATDSHTVPRMVFLVNGKIPINHKEVTSSEYFYFNFVKSESFILSKNGGAMDVFKGIKIPFVFEDFLSLIKNNYFVDDLGSKGRIDKIVWDSYADSAVVDYRVQNDYTKGKLKETYIRYD